ncbi:Subunit of Golgi mannosyltransferase complex [Blumeria graminis f. sp. tritici 96224]|uniref:Bgt-14 n=2 Tax=Blumeria graminis f. sp. tritici TaxID=62690 RepID=A0A061HJE0_BLUGR|nr:Subunit of Golgi mannosyltransferase complex [Blumeria graminis f. sp. tritici 96224]
MGSIRISRRTNPLTIIGGVILCIITFFFFSSHSNTDKVASQLRTAGSTSNSLFPHTSPFRKRQRNTDGSRKPPPVVHYQMNSVSTSSDPVGNRERVLILTPLERFYQGYWDNLMLLSYPHELITLGFIIPKNRQGNIAMAALQEQIAKTQKLGPAKDKFASIIVERQDFEFPLASQSDAERHKLESQKIRRAAMSKARNSLLFTTLGPAISWVLWIDSEIIETPKTLIQDLASHNKPIIVPNCFEKYPDQSTQKPTERPYDYSNWQDSETAQDLARKMGPDDILLEGYAELATYRNLMVFMPTDDGDPRMEIDLDGVGGTVLLVKAEVHRDGAMFPPFPFYHLIETEGFAKMAKRLGWNATGLPNYKVKRPPHLTTKYSLKTIGLS